MFHRWWNFVERNYQLWQAKNKKSKINAAQNQFQQPGMDNEIKINIKSWDKCQRTRKDKSQSATYASPLPQYFEPIQ
jgi:hypothetical protein